MMLCKPQYHVYNLSHYSILVGGEANFAMTSTQLTIGGFTQPRVARNLIEMPSNSEKGLSHRFVWIFPKPLYGKFATLEYVDKLFSSKIGKYK